MTRVKTREIRGKKKEDLTKQLEEQKKELASLRVSKVGLVLKLALGDS